MTEVFLFALTGVGLILGAVGWSNYGAVLATKSGVRDERTPKAMVVIGDPKLIWAWILIVAVTGSLLASRMFDGWSNSAVLVVVFGYAFFWLLLGAIFTRMRKSSANSSELGYKGWPTLCLWLVGIGAVFFVAVLLLGLWMKLGS